MQAAGQLANEGIEAEVVHLASIKPIDCDLILDSVSRTGCAVTAENASILGGMGSAVMEVIAENYPVPVRRIGVRDRWVDSGGIDELFTLPPHAAGGYCPGCAGVHPEQDIGKSAMSNTLFPSIDPAQLFSDYLRVTGIAHLGPEPSGEPGLVGKRLGLLNGSSWITLWSNYFGRLYLPGRPFGECWQRSRPAKLHGRSPKGTPLPAAVEYRGFYPLRP